ncbi:hypothetical protein Q1695_002973 [Nippostrongylus brasiliensis]|nr:hypothetical protein Q1695_002973 [Nippostrongylus brasiliensis]
MATPQTNAEVISSMERQYAEQKAKFEKWKIDNSRQIGTESYNKYVQQFLQWEKEVFEKKAKVVALAQTESSTAIAGPANVDSILGQLLDDVLPMEFLMALESPERRVHGSITTTCLNGPVSSYTRSSNTAVLSSCGNDSTSCSSTSRYDSWHHSDMGYYHGSSWPQIQVINLTPPSPVRDYKNPVARMPFRDFSQ